MSAAARLDRRTVEDGLRAIKRKKEERAAAEKRMRESQESAAPDAQSEAAGAQALTKQESTDSAAEHDPTPQP